MSFQRFARVLYDKLSGVACWIIVIPIHVNNYVNPKVIKSGEQNPMLKESSMLIATSNTSSSGDLK